MKRCSHELFRWSLMHSVRVPHPENGRQRFRLVCSSGDTYRGCCFLDLVCLGPERDGARSHCGCVGPDYCLSLRAGTGHADVDNGGVGKGARPGC